MYRAIAIVGAALMLAACSSFKSVFHFEPPKDTIQFESQPPGALAQTSTDQSCMTPCALAMPADKPFSVTYTLNGYQPDTEQVEIVSMGDGTSKLRPNPVLAALTPNPPPPKPKRVHHRRRATKPKSKPKPKPVAKDTPKRAAPAPASAPTWPTAQPQAASPWPSATSQQQPPQQQ